MATGKGKQTGKSKGNDKNKGGRPPALIDWTVVDKLIEAGAGGVEVSAYLGISPDTLYRHCQADRSVGFAEYLRQKRAKGDTRLRVKQYQAAMQGDKTMMIWLGKQRLGQSDKVVADTMHRFSDPEDVDLSNATDDELAAIERAEDIKEQLRERAAGDQDVDQVDGQAAENAE